MYNAGDIAADIFNVFILASLFDKLPNVFIFVYTDNLKKIRVVVLEVKLITRVGLV